MDYDVRSVPSGAKRGWNTEAVSVKDGQLTHLKLSSRFGTLEVGQLPSGYDGWVFKETGGGGSVTLLWCRGPDGVILVGLLPERRANMGPDPVLCIVGGFIHPGEAHVDAQRREAEAEAGLGALKTKELQGHPVNPNRAFFVADPGQDEGVHLYAIEVPFEWLSSVEGEGTYRLAHLPEGAESKLGKAGQVVFLSWQAAATESVDCIAHSAILRLVSAELF